MKKFRLTKENSKDIDFAVDCLNLEDLKKWVYYVLENSDIDDVPTYLFDILDLKEEHKARSVQPWLGGDFTSQEYMAFEGIERKRGLYLDLEYDGRPTDKEAIQALKDCPHIEKRFREAFPFIEWEGFLDPITLKPKENI